MNTEFSAQGTCLNRLLVDSHWGRPFASWATTLILEYSAHGIQVHFLARSSMVQRFSIYTRLSRVWDAHSHGMAKYVDSNGQTVLLLRSEYLSLYLENSGIIHNATDKTLANIVDVYGETRPGMVPARGVFVGRRKITVTHVQYGRSPQFRQEVLSAYGNKCAMCGVQLELIEAAHTWCPMHIPRASMLSKME